MGPHLEQLIGAIVRAEADEPFGVSEEQAQQIPPALAVLEDDEVRSFCQKALALSEGGPERWGLFVLELVSQRDWVLAEHLIRACQLRAALGEVSASDVMLWAKGLRRYPSLERSPSGALDDHDLIVAAALARVHQTIRNTSMALEEAAHHLNDFETGAGGPHLVTYFREWFLKDPGLVSLITEHADQADEIAAVIAERRTADPTVLRTVLGGVPALRDGEL